MTADNTHDREGAPSPATHEDRRATTADLSPIANRPIAADSRDLARLRQRFDGQVLLPDEPGYHQARQVWNAMVDRKPAVIARCVSPADVAAAVGFARSHELEIGVRCGGHSVLGISVPQGGLVDVHTHPGAEHPGDGLDEALLRRHGNQHCDAGVTLLRVPGSARRLPAWFGQDDQLPRVYQAGPWLAAKGRVFPGWGRQVEVAALPEVAVEEAKASGGWCKVIADWSVGEGAERRHAPSVPPLTAAPASA